MTHSRALASPMPCPRILMRFRVVPTYVWSRTRCTTTIWPRSPLMILPRLCPGPYSTYTLIWPHHDASTSHRTLVSMDSRRRSAPPTWPNPLHSYCIHILLPPCWRLTYSLDDVVSRCALVCPPFEFADGLCYPVARGTGSPSFVAMRRL